MTGTSMPAVTSDHRDGGGLSPADVHHKVFSTVRFREGYAMAEVDGFLAQVEVTLTRLLHERATLTARLGSPPRSGGPSATSAGENVARIVAVAQQAADQVIRDAHEQAAEIITQAHARADAVEHAAAGQARQIQGLIRNLERQAGALLRELDPSPARATVTEHPAAEDTGPLGRTAEAAGPAKDADHAEPLVTGRRARTERTGTP
ncbi:hypothetical protein Ssi03_48470 [Sphaerisporangium siamense]|uniref:Cell wall synthesis protein Wag31 n=1 Tax=Sphaerisporangium siamense TaxID=795645 RepID=A0A7W7G9Z1_9ACTN|nr:DivIVA domain-containing protein [Sphaerisporangium siamense]MBB4699446.1 DivIVA domain-containing protein [Sphaerisporangium siamense]GII86857.1 hypothetical protein Ssi03_48470 [Sphaerisporangium siamense]